jgi:hypothetical protein
MKRTPPKKMGKKDGMNCKCPLWIVKRPYGYKIFETLVQGKDK